jgi:GT2 family glycosyltransferase
MSAPIPQASVGKPVILHRISGSPTRHTETTTRYDGLFDIFPESYWARFTALRHVGLRCQVTEPCRLRLVRRLADGTGTEVLVCESAGGESIVLQAPLADPQAPESYLFLEVISGNSHSTVSVSAVWETTQPPLRVPRIGVAITTFNREAFLVANLVRLDGHLAGGRVVVVNHGAPGLEDRLRDQLPETLAVSWIDQENSGGAGGFTRGMLEHREAGDITHVLLMDDDIDLPADLVERTAAVLSFTRPEICLGGAMFDYHERGHLFSAGDILLPGSFGIAHVAPPEGCDIGTTKGVDFLARVHRPDFNGWWCFAFPIEALDAVGLPMACFIRGDDVEFGYRLKQAGMPTLGWPGLAVWHMPFADKSAPWHMFYDRRNSLFANARHRRIGRRAGLGKLIGGFTHHLLRYDYDRVRAMTLGIVAFSQGAARMEEWTHLDHTLLIAETSKMQIGDCETVMNLHADADFLEPDRLSGFVRSAYMAGRMFLDLAGLPNGTSKAVRLAPGVLWRPDFEKRPSAVLESDGQGKTIRLYRRDTGQSRQAIWACIRALLGMIWHFHQPVPIRFPVQKTPSRPLHERGYQL